MWFKRFTLLALTLSLALAGCGGAPQAKTYKVGVMVALPWLEVIYDNFKINMTELGYVEGQNITYLYDPHAGPDQAAFDQEALRLMNEKVDLFFAIGTEPALAAKKAVAGTEIPVVFTPVIDPVAMGVVSDVLHPGGNVTGVQVVDQSSKGLEWLLKVVPSAKHVYIPYASVDLAALPAVEALRQAAPQLGVEFLPSEVANIEEMLARVDSLPPDTVIYAIVPIQSLEPGLEALGKLAVERKIPLGAYNRTIGVVPFPMINYSVDVVDEARQGANMVDRIFKGAQPADTPVETAEYFLYFDLKQAKAFGVEIPDDLLRQAHTILR